MDATKKWRFRFGLKSLLVYVTIASISLAWIGYQLRWIGERRAFIRAHGTRGGTYAKFPPTEAPLSLRLFGENPVDFWDASMNPNDLREAMRLFPESEPYVLEHLRSLPRP